MSSNESSSAAGRPELDSKPLLPELHLPRQDSDQVMKLQQLNCSLFMPHDFSLRVFRSPRRRTTRPSWRSTLPGWAWPHPEEEGAWPPQACPVPRPPSSRRCLRSSESSSGVEALSWGRSGNDEQYKKTDLMHQSKCRGWKKNNWWRKNGLNLSMQGWINYEGWERPPPPPERNRYRVGKNGETGGNRMTKHQHIHPVEHFPPPDSLLCLMNRVVSSLSWNSFCCRLLQVDSLSESYLSCSSSISMILLSRQTFDVNFFNSIHTYIFSCCCFHRLFTLVQH